MPKTICALPPNYLLNTRLSGMKVLDKASFEQCLSYSCVNVPYTQCNSTGKLLKSWLLKIPNFKAVKDNEKKDGKLFVLNPLAVSTLFLHRMFAIELLWY